MKLKATILLNESGGSNRWLNGWESGDPVRVAFTYDVLEPELFPTIEEDSDVCEQAFHLFNAPDEMLTARERVLAESYRFGDPTLRNSSLSIGDLVAVTRGTITRFYAVRSAGFARVDFLGTGPTFVGSHEVLQYDGSDLEHWVVRMPNDDTVYVGRVVNGKLHAVDSHAPVGEAWDGGCQFLDMHRCDGRGVTVERTLTDPTDIWAYIEEWAS